MQTNPESAAVEVVALEYVPGRLDETAPARIWLQIDVMADNDERSDTFPGPEHVTWQDESLGGLEVQYIRADLHQSALDALRGEVERLRAALEAIAWTRSPGPTPSRVPGSVVQKMERIALNALTKESP